MDKKLENQERKISPEITLICISCKLEMTAHSTLKKRCFKCRQELSRERHYKRRLS